MLMSRICQIMEEQRLYLNPNLKVSDIATALGTNRNSISSCINSQRDCTFPQFVNTYRVAHAQELLRNQPDLKIADVCLASGFSSEASFYRIFKTVSGTTPTDWRAQTSQNKS
jgi:AraC-like DNA-binding protein